MVIEVNGIHLSAYVSNPFSTVVIKTITNLKWQNTRCTCISHVFIFVVYIITKSKLFAVTPQFFIDFKYSYTYFFYFKWKTMSKKKICQLFVVCLLIYSTSSLQVRLSTVFFLGNFKKSNEKRNSIYLMFSFIETYQLRFMWVMHIQYTLDLKRADSFFAYRG